MVTIEKNNTEIVFYFTNGISMQDINKVYDACDEKLHSKKAKELFKEKLYNSEFFPSTKNYTNKYSYQFNSIEELKIKKLY